MTYVDGFILAVPEKNIEAYRKMSEDAGKIWMEYGALAYVETLADDVPEGKVTDFYRAVKCEEGETVVFAWIVYKSREHRDDVNKKVMADKRLGAGMDCMPFDGKRMIFGGFKTFVEM